MMAALKKVIAMVSLAMFLAGCSGAAAPEQEPGVEDLNPGDRTVIDSPAQPQGNNSGVQEKSI